MEQQMSGDSVLVEKAKAGDEKAFAEIVAAHKSPVFNLAYSITGNRADADDVAQEVFVKVYFALPKFEARSSLRTWLYRITLNAAYDRARKTRKTVSALDPAGQNDTPAAAVADVSGDGAVLRARLDRALAALPAKYRAVISLREFERLTYEEISRALGVSVGKVKIWIFRARKTLKEKFAPEKKDEL